MLAARRSPSDSTALVVNDVHSQLNLTRVAACWKVASVDDARLALQQARQRGLAICIAGGRHAMGGQQFLAGGLLLDTTALNRVLHLDREQGLLTVEAGIQWPALLADLQQMQPHETQPWTIRQKQTGADDLSLGGALAANIHGRGLRFAPFVADIERFELLDGAGVLHSVDRRCDPERFALVVGGYGLFGLVTSITLRLMRREVLERCVEITRCAQVVSRLESAAAAGALYGDFQFSVDPGSDDFLDRGVLSYYAPTPPGSRPTLAAQLRREDFHRLLLLAHVDKRRAFEQYATHYLATDGHRYFSDTQQAGFDLAGYHSAIDGRLGYCGSERIIELFVPRPALPIFLAQVAATCRHQAIDIVYGTVRMIAAEHETRLNWARGNYAGVVLNLRVRHSKSGLGKARDDQRRLTDLALACDGSFYLTYDNYATRAQLDRAYPQMSGFLRAKERYDPERRFQSGFYRQWLSQYPGLVP